MFKKTLIILGFMGIFALGIWAMFALQNRIQPENVAIALNTAENQETETYNDEKVYRYKAEDLQSECLADDQVFCAVERTVKCTITPELETCDAEYVPSFVLGKTKDVERPTEIAFKMRKIKPNTDSSDISVYTESECNAKWFGLCQGTVVYALTPKNGQWAVINIFAME